MGGGSGLSQAGFMNGERPAHRLSDPWRSSGSIAAPGIPGELARLIEKPISWREDLSSLLGRSLPSLLFAGVYAPAGVRALRTIWQV